MDFWRDGSLILGCEVAEMPDFNGVLRYGVRYGIRNGRLGVLVNFIGDFGN